MKLRNKKTGEIVDLLEIIRLDDISNEFYLRLSDKEGRTFKVGFNSLAELNEVWEDYKEPEIFYVIDLDGEILPSDFENETIEKSKELGNYFETQEEAEKAVEKLKAWKRLKDKGFEFDVIPSLGHCDDEKFDISIIGSMPAKWWYNDKVVDDIHFIFGGEE